MDLTFMQTGTHFRVIITWMIISQFAYLVNESMVSLVLRQYMRGENGTESLSCLFE